MIVESVGALAGAIKAGTVRPLAVESTARLSDYPDVPTASETFLRKDGKWISIGVMGVFEFVDGKIAAQRDYFDMQTFRNQMADYDQGRKPSKDK